MKILIILIKYKTTIIIKIIKISNLNIKLNNTLKTNKKKANNNK